MNLKLSNTIVSLKNFSILKALSTAEIEKVAEQVEVIKIKKGEFIYEEEDSSNGIYFVESGKIKLATKTENGKTLIKDIIHAGSIFGENIFQEKSNRTEYAISADKSNTVFLVPKSIIMELVLNNEDFSQDLMTLIMQRMNNLEERMKNFIFLKAKSRISEFIGRMGSQRGIKIGMDEWLVNHGLSHKEIAYMTDTSRQTVARVLGELKKENLIHFSARKPSKILIRNIAALRKS